ncbi:MAG: hypothetical protein ACRBFS_23175 [Aureispira sp.]
MLTTDPFSQREELSPKAIKSLRTTSRWVRFFGVLSFISSLFSIIGISGAITTIIKESEDASVLYALLAIVLLLVIVAASLYISFVLFDYGATTSRFAKTTDYNHLGKAFKRQLTYWRWIGILVTVIFAFYLLSFVFTLALTARL